jgi:hypothetical protein
MDIHVKSYKGVGRRKRGKEQFFNLLCSKISVILRINLKLPSVLDVNQNSEVRRQDDFWIPENASRCFPTSRFPFLSDFNGLKCSSGQKIGYSSKVFKKSNLNGQCEQLLPRTL